MALFMCESNLHLVSFGTIIIKNACILCVLKRKLLNLFYFLTFHVKYSWRRRRFWVHLKLKIIVRCKTIWWHETLLRMWRQLFYFYWNTNRGAPKHYSELWNNFKKAHRLRSKNDCNCKISFNWLKRLRMTNPGKKHLHRHDSM